MPLVAIAPLKCTIPLMLVTAALLVPKGAFVQPFASASDVRLGGDTANAAPSSSTQHAPRGVWGASASTVTTPLGSIMRRPLASQRLTGTYTDAAGRKPTGNVKAWELVPLAVMVPLKCTIPSMLATAAGLMPPPVALYPPFCRVSGVHVAACSTDALAPGN